MKMQTSQDARDNKHGWLLQQFSGAPVLFLLDAKTGLYNRV